jgi:hypothetical protein
MAGTWIPATPYSSSHVGCKDWCCHDGEQLMTPMNLPIIPIDSRRTTTLSTASARSPLRETFVPQVSSHRPSASGSRVHPVPCRYTDPFEIRPSHAAIDWSKQCDAGTQQLLDVPSQRGSTTATPLCTWLDVHGAPHYGVFDRRSALPSCSKPRSWGRRATRWCVRLGSDRKTLHP